jgi:hypothetical protein
VRVAECAISLQSVNLNYRVLPRSYSPSVLFKSLKVGSREDSNPTLQCGISPLGVYFVVLVGAM